MCSIWLFRGIPFRAAAGNSVRRLSMFALLTLGLLGVNAGLVAQTTATLEGTVKDQQGLAVPQAQVYAVSTSSATARQTVTDANGTYRIAGLPAGIYSLKLSKDGFAAEEAKDLQLTVNVILTYDFVLRIGAKNETVEVSGAPLLDETTTSSTGATITPQLIEQMPLNGRNYLDLLQLVPGVALNRQVDPSLDAAAPILGERGGNALFLIDGMPNSDVVNGGAASQFDQDSILEFQVLTAGYKAEFGHAAGGTINVVTKSGTNHLHGGGSFFHRNYKLDSPNVPGQKAPPFLLRWDSSAQLGGPVVKDKIFFFASAERVRESRELNFQFPPGVPAFLETQEEALDRHSQTYDTRLRARLDEQLGHHHFGEHMNLTNTHITDFLPLQLSTNLPSTRTNTDARHLMLGGNDTATLGNQSNPFLLTWYAQYRGEPSVIKAAHPEIGPQLTADNLFSSLDTGGLFGDLGSVSVGPGFTPLNLKQKYVSFGSNIAKQFGNHNWKFGWDFERSIVDGNESKNLLEQLFATVAAQQQFGFQQSGTYILDAQSNDDPNALRIRLRNNYNGLYVQDDWKVASTLTLNLGLRWDYDSEFPNKKNFSPRAGFAWSVNPKTVVRGSFGLFYDHFRLGIGRDIPGFGGANITRTRYFSFPQLFYGNPSILTAFFASVFSTPCVSSNQTDAQITASGAVCPFTGPTGQTLPFFGIDHLNNIVAPGHAPIPPNTPININNVQALTGFTPQEFAAAASVAVDQPANFFSYDPFGNLTSLALAVPGLSTPITVDPNFSTPYNRTYYLGVQRQLSANTALMIDYFHRDFRNILGIRDANLAFEARLPGNTLELQPGTGGTLIQSFGPTYHGTFDGITIGLTKRMSKRFTFSANYTWAHDIDNALNASFISNFQTGAGLHFATNVLGPTDSFVGVVPLVVDSVSGKTNADGPFITGDGIPEDGGNPVPKAGTHYDGADLDKGPSDLAHKHTFNVNGVIDLPWKFQVTGIFRAQSGFHYSQLFVNGDDVDGDGLFNGIDWTKGRNHFIAPTFVNQDVRVAKRLDFGDRYKLHLYFEMFNLFNRGNPAAVQQLPEQPVPVGQITQRLPGREGQVGLHFEF